jgi:hypothetical protein
VSVTNRGTGTLLKVIKGYCFEPGTIRTSDCWTAYDRVETEGFQQLTVNHSISFVDSETATHKQNGERLWREVRGNIPRFENRKHHFHSHLCEFLYRYAYMWEHHSIRNHSIFTSIVRVCDGETTSRQQEKEDMPSGSQ